MLQMLRIKGRGTGVRAMATSEAAIRAIEALNEVCGKRESKPATSAKGDGWSARSLDAERRFGQPHAKLFPYLGRKVRTPAGPGTLLQVFAARATVLLDSELSRCSFFPPTEIVPVSSLKGEVKKKHKSNGWIFSRFAALLFEQDLF
jgi:hypothetical protein